MSDSSHACSRLRESAVAAIIYPIISEEPDTFFDCVEEFSVLENLKVKVEIEEGWISNSIGDISAYLEEEEKLALNCLERTTQLVINLFDLAAEMSCSGFELGDGFPRLLELSEVVRVMDRSLESLQKLLVPAGPPIVPTEILKLCRHALIDARLSTSQLMQIYCNFLA